MKAGQKPASSPDSARLKPVARDRASGSTRTLTGPTAEAPIEINYRTRRARRGKTPDLGVPDARALCHLIGLRPSLLFRCPVWSVFVANSVLRDHLSLYSSCWPIVYY